VELHIIREFEDSKLTFCCNDITGLPTTKKSGLTDVICEMFDLNTANEGPGNAQGDNENPDSSTHATLTDTMSEELDWESINEMRVGNTIDERTRRPADVPLSSLQPVPSSS
jgi:hypothetical protein